jgi:hypothetical protein
LKSPFSTTGWDCGDDLFLLLWGVLDINTLDDTDRPILVFKLRR